MKRIIVFLLVFISLFLLFACSGSKEDNIEGIWKGKFDYAPYANKLLDYAATVDYEEEKKYYDLKNIVLEIEFKFNQDGTYFMNINEEKLKKDIDNNKDAIKQGLIRQYEDYIDSKGLNQTIEQYIDENKTSIDEKINIICNADVFYIPKEQWSGRGIYKIKGNKLFYAKSNGQFEDDKYIEFKINGNKLELVRCSGEYFSEYKLRQFGDVFERMFREMYPITFDRK